MLWQCRPFLQRIVKLPAHPCTSEGRASTARSAGEDAPDEGDANDPTRAGEDHRLPPLAASVRVQIGTGQEEDREDSVHDMEQLGRPLTERQRDETDEAL